jgi:5-keto 4-deoxyuronate isomerase
METVDLKIKEKKATFFFKKNGITVLYQMSTDRFFIDSFMLISNLVKVDSQSGTTIRSDLMDRRVNVITIMEARQLPSTSTSSLRE